MTRIARCIVLVVAVAAVGGCSTWGEKQDITRDWSEQRLYTAAKERLASSDYEQAIDYYKKLEARYPFSPLAMQAQLDIIYAYYKFKETASAIAAADQFIKLHPRHPKVDYAYYLKGLVYFVYGKSYIDYFLPEMRSERDPSILLQSFRAFEELVRRFPESRYAADARQRMLYLKNTLAVHEIHVARYYMKREAYLAAVNRARHVVEQYQGTPAVADALFIMAKAYQLMELDDLRSDAVRVLKVNYPEYPGLDALESPAGK